MPGLKKVRGDGREDAIALDDELFRVLPDDEGGRRGRRPRAGAAGGPDPEDLIEDDLDDADDPLSDARRGRLGGRGGGGGGRPAWLPLIALLAVALAGWGVWMALAPAPEPTPATGDMLATVQPAGPGDGPDLPLVRAETEPYKTAPSDPGGLQVENTDKEVYARVRDSAQVDEGPAVEQLLPGPTRPVSPPAPEAPANATQDAPPTPEPAQAQTPAPEAPQPSDTAPRTASDGPPPVPEGPLERATPPEAEDSPAAMPQPAPPEVPATAAAPSSEPTQTPASASTPAPAEQVAAVAEDGPQVQLAAFRKRELAQQHWNTLRQAHPDLLSAVPHLIVFADLGDQGQFYRLRAGPMSNPDAAGALCRALKQRDVGCFVVSE